MKAVVVRQSLCEIKDLLFREFQAVNQPSLLLYTAHVLCCTENLTVSKGRVGHLHELIVL